MFHFVFKASLTAHVLGGLTLTLISQWHFNGDKKPYYEAKCHDSVAMEAACQVFGFSSWWFFLLSVKGKLKSPQTPLQSPHAIQDVPPHL